MVPLLAMSALPWVTLKAPVTVAACSAVSASMGTIAIGTRSPDGALAGAGTGSAEAGIAACVNATWRPARIRTARLAAGSQARSTAKQIRLGQKPNRTVVA